MGLHKSAYWNLYQGIGRLYSNSQGSAENSTCLHFILLIDLFYWGKRLTSDCGVKQNNYAPTGHILLSRTIAYRIVINFRVQAVIATILCLPWFTNFW